MSRPARRVKEAPELATFAGHMVRLVGAKAADDVDALPLLAGLGALVDAQLQQAVDGCRRRGWSWTDIGRVLGMSRQAAHQRFSGPPVQGTR